MVPQTEVIVSMSHANVSNAISFTEKETGFRVYSLVLCHTALEGQLLQTALAFYLMGPLRFEAIGAEVPKLQSSHGPAWLAAQRCSKGLAGAFRD